MKKVGKLAAVLVVMAAAIGMMGCAQGAGGSTPAKPDYGTCVVGDFILKDGSILKNTDSLTLSDKQKSNVAAVIVRAADKSTNTPALGVGIVHQTGLKWCTSSATGYNTKIEALFGDKTSGYMDGSNSWALLNTAVNNDAINNPDNYPAWKFCKDYATGKGFSSDLATGWYLPTAAELKTIYDSKGVINTSLGKAGGNQFGDYWYWSCCQDPSNNIGAREISFKLCNMSNFSKDDNTCYVCAVRAFN